MPSRLLLKRPTVFIYHSQRDEANTVSTQVRSDSNQKIARFDDAKSVRVMFVHRYSVYTCSRVFVVKIWWC